MTKNAVVVKEETAIAMTDLMADIGISPDDLVIPQLMLMQGTSEYVGDDKAKMGDIINSQSLEVLGSPGSPVEIIPLKLYKTWREYDVSGANPKFRRVYGVDSSNSDSEWKFTEDGIQMKRVLNLNFFVLIKKELEAGEGFPAFIAFKSTSMQAGKNLATQLFKMAAIGRLPYSQTVLLSVKKEKKETNTYAVFECLKGNPTSDEHKAEAKKWIGILATQKHTIDTKEEAESSAPRSTFKPEAMNTEEVEQF